MMDLRTLSKHETKAIGNDDYVLGIDVARSQSTANNQCSVAVLKIKKNAQGKITTVQLVNIINIPSIVNFKVQAQEVMRIKNRYNAKVVVVDSNGLGRMMPLMGVISYEKFGEPRNLGCAYHNKKIDMC